MPASVRLMPDWCTGHSPCYPPRRNTSGSHNVFINTYPAHRVGDSWEAHCCPGGGCHSGRQSTGSRTYFCNGRPLARVGDNINCGSRNATGSPNHYVNT